MTKIWERLYLGSLKDAAQLARSNPRRIATVISLCREKNLERARNIIYFHIPIPDAAPISAQKFEDIMYAIAIGVRSAMRSFAKKSVEVEAPPSSAPPRASQSSGDLATNRVTSNDFGWDVGGGVIGMLNDHVGLRGDVRYFRSNKSGGGFNFWRGDGGVSSKF